MEERKTESEMRELLTKKPFTRIKATGHYNHGEFTHEVSEVPVKPDYLTKVIMTQADFIRELHPESHLINDRDYFPDVWRKADDGRWYKEEVPRYAFAFQDIILTKHLTHLCGNDIVFELADKKDDDAARQVCNAFRQGWANKNMETAWYNVAKSAKATGDGAMVGFVDKGKFGWKTLSYIDGDELYPHYDPITGKMNCFARAYNNFNQTGKVTNRYVEVWTDTTYARYVSGAAPETKTEKVLDVIAGIFNLNGYKKEYECKHGFPFIPVAYKRDDNGPCWSKSQDAIDNYEFTFSRMAQNSHIFGLPVMYVKGEGSNMLSEKDMTHAAKVLFLPEDGEAGYLSVPDASNAYKGELNLLEENIYTQSFAVKPPELKSGDLPAAAIRLLYSPAIENAMRDCNEYDELVDKMVEIFSFGYGIEAEMRLEFANTSISHYIQPFVFLNETEQSTNLATLVQNKIISRQTASEKSAYATPQEYDRLMNEQHENEMNELMLEEQKLEIQNEATIEVAQAQAEVQTEQQIAVQQAQQSQEEDGGKKPSKNVGGSNATGRGTNGHKRGRPNRTGRRYTESGNWEGRSGWEEFNLKH